MPAARRAGAGEGGEAELADFTPAFLWLLRDFYLTLEEDGRQARGGPPLPRASSVSEGGAVTSSAQRELPCNQWGSTPNPLECSQCGCMQLCVMAPVWGCCLASAEGPPTRQCPRVCR